MSGVEAALLGAWNPLHGLDEHHEALIDRASSIAGALVVPGRGEDGHWDESARQLVKALILLVVLHYEPAQRTLLTVHALLMRGVQDQPELGWGSVPSGPDDPTPMQLLLASMQMEQRLDGLVAGAANTLIDMGERERGSVLSTARRNLEWLERPAMRRVVERSTFDLEALKGARAGFSLFLCLPPQRMADCGRWLRLVITAALESCYASSEPPQSSHPVLFLLEEFPVLKHMEIIETAAGYAAGFGIKLWIIVQDLTQLKRHYKESWETFIGNAGVIQAFGNSDQTTLDYFSKRLGQVEVSQSVTNTTTSLSASSNDPGEFQAAASLFQSRGPASLLTNPLLLAFNQQSTGQSATTSTAMNQQIIRTPLILPDEIERQFRREAMNQIVSVKGFAPFVLARVTYHEAPEFLGLYEPDREPRHTREAAAAERTRRLEAWRTRTAGLIEAADQFVTKAHQEIEAARARKR